VKRRKNSSCFRIEEIFDSPFEEIFDSPFEEIFDFRQTVDIHGFATTSFCRYLQQNNIMDEGDTRRAHAADGEEEAVAIGVAAAAAAAAPLAAAATAGGEALAPPPPVTAPATLADLEAERALHCKRAERFGGDFIDPVSRFFFADVALLLSFFFSFFLSSSLSHKKTQLQTQLQLFQLQAKKAGPLRDVERRARLERKDGFVTGIDLFADEERARIAARAARFGKIAPLSDAAADASNPSASAASVAPPPLSGTAVPIRNVSYAPDEDELRKRARASRFQTPYDGGEGLMMEVDLLEERRPLPPAGTVERCPEKIHVYGVDVLSTSEILRYFTEWGPTYVEWLDDSSANVVFADGLTAKRALVGRGRPMPPDDANEGGGGGGGGGGDSAAPPPPLDPTDIRNAPFLWHRGDDVTKAGTAVPIVYRMATVVSWLEKR